MKPFIIFICGFFIQIAVQVNASEKPLTVGILLYPGVQIIDFAGPYEVFGWAEYKVSTVSQDGKPLATTMDLTITPTYGFSEAPIFDILVVPGGDIDHAFNTMTLDWIRKKSQSARRVLSVCNGAFILAETGLLNGLSATTFYPALEALKDNYPKVKTVSDKRFVDNGKFVTSAGLSSGIDAALYLVAQDLGIAKAKSIAANIEYKWHPESGYVRGNMADSQLVSIRKNLFELINSEPIYSYGSETEWFASYSLNHLTLDDHSEAVQKNMALAITATHEWTLVKGIWHKKADGNKKWMLAITYLNSSKKIMGVKFHLYQKP